MKTMNVGEFAKRMQVSVRTLQYYDQIDLLKPSGYSEGGRRLYTSQDSFVFFQIKALKQLGFRLDEIKEQLLENKDIETFKELLRNQKDEVERQIQNLQQAKVTITKMESEINQMEDLDYDAYLEILQMIVNPYGHWAMTSFNDTLHNHVSSKFLDKPDTGLRIYETWNRLSNQTLSFIQQGITPESKEGQELAEVWWDMVMEFTGGDMSLLQHLEAFNDNKENWDEDIANRQKQIDAYIEKALELYVPNYYTQSKEEAS